MIIDCHTHIGRNDHIKASAEDLLRSMDKAGIDKSLVFASEIGDCTNRWLMEQVADHRDRLLPVASVSLTNIYALPGCTGVDTGDMSIWDMLNALNDGAVAVKLYTGYEHFSPNSERVRHILDIVGKSNKPVIFHTGDCLNSVCQAKLKYAQPLDVDDVAVDYPNINFIIAHMGFPWVRDAAEVCYKNANVYADMSGFVYDKFTDLNAAKFAKVIADFTDIAPVTKLLFGSDFPISNQESYINTIRDYVYLGIHSKYLFHNNIVKAFNLL